jgi:phenylacetyl-CoA:acceptor oxidoreductase subunit 2
MSGRGGAKPYLQPFWDWRAASNFSFGGTGSGLLMLSPLAVYEGVAPWPYLLAGLAFMGLGLGLVWLEIGKKLRAMNVFLQPMSWMARESYVAVMAFGLGLAAAWQGGWILVSGTALAGAFFVYAQALILRKAKGIPAWRAPRLTPLIIATGLAEGASLTLAITLVAGYPIIKDMPVFVFFLLALRFLFWRRYRLGAALPDAARRVLARLNPVFTIWGHALPALLLIAVPLIPHLSAPIAAAAAFCLVTGGWALKFTIVTRAAYTQGFAITYRPGRGPVGSCGPGAKPGYTTLE